MTTPTTQPDDRYEQIARDIRRGHIARASINNWTDQDRREDYDAAVAFAIKAAEQRGREEGKRPKLCQVCGDPILDVHICSGAEKFPEVAEMAGGDTGACFGPSAMGVSESSQAPDPHQQPKSEDEVLRQLRQEVAPRIKALKESERNVFEQPKSEPSRECRQRAYDCTGVFATKIVRDDEIVNHVAAALQAKQDELEALRSEVLGVIEPFATWATAFSEAVSSAEKLYLCSDVHLGHCRAALALRDKLKASQLTLPQPQTPHQ